MTVGVAGAGFSGAVIARQLADAGHRVIVFDPRNHVAGNCHTERDDRTGVMVHVYGPHIFHTPHREVWEYVHRFGEMMPYRHRVMATVGDRIYSMPINLLTINQFFGRNMTPSEAQSFVSDLTAPVVDPRTFEEQGLSLIGRELYEAFFAGYTSKQWGRSPSDLPASVMRRLPLRFNYDDGYFSHPYQGIPRHGYTALVENILDHDLIEVRLKDSLSPQAATHFEHLVWTGPVDAFFNYEHGRLPYRTLDFVRETHTDVDVQGCAVMNYCDEDVPYTRVTEHRYFTPWESPFGSVTYCEYSRECDDGDVPYYPVNLAAETEQVAAYRRLSMSAPRVTFSGRLGTYRYLDMDVTIKEALETAQRLIHEVL